MQFVTLIFAKPHLTWGLRFLPSRNSIYVNPYLEQIGVCFFFTTTRSEKKVTYIVKFEKIELPSGVVTSTEVTSAEMFFPNTIAKYGLLTLATSNAENVGTSLSVTEQTKTETLSSYVCRTYLRYQRHWLRRQSTIPTHICDKLCVSETHMRIVVVAVSKRIT